MDSLKVTLMSGTKTYLDLVQRWMHEMQLGLFMLSENQQPPNNALKPKHNAVFRYNVIIPFTVWLCREIG